MLTRKQLQQLACRIKGTSFTRSLTALPEVASEGPKLPPFDYVPPPYDGPSKEEVMATRKQFLSPGRSVSST